MNFQRATGCEARLTHHVNHEGMRTATTVDCAACALKGAPIRFPRASFVKVVRVPCKQAERAA